MPQQRDNRVRHADEHAAQYPALAAAMELCCVPTGCHSDEPMRADSAVRVICNNEHCPQSQLMHRACFEEWENAVLSFLRSTGRARSWSEKQRLQNLWTKKGYDLAYKACGCRCGKGHLRKDLDWVPPAADDAKKKQRRRRGNDKPSLNKPPPPSSVPVTRLRSSSMSSTGSAGSPPSSSSPEFPPSPTHKLFSRRQDYSSFNALPRHKINAYHIKMEDDGDDIRCFILNTLGANKTSRVACVVCHAPMCVFDRYPLVDGTLFLSPRQHSPGSVRVRVDDERAQYLNAVCMRCLEGWPLACGACGARWSGRHLILGTMYAYDIFAATPCCEERLRCSSCRRPFEERSSSARSYFSDYSHCVGCAHCGARDYHFVKPLSTYVRL